MNINICISIDAYTYSYIYIAFKNVKLFNSEDYQCLVEKQAQNISKPCLPLVGFVSHLKCKASSVTESIKAQACQMQSRDSV
jgi:hypothetical protein